MKTRKKPGDPIQGKADGVTLGSKGTHNELGGRKTMGGGYKTTYIPKKGTKKPESVTGDKRKVTKKEYIISERRSGQKVLEPSTRTDRKSLLNKNIEKTKVKSASGTKKVKTNLSTGRIDVKYKAKK